MKILSTLLLTAFVSTALISQTYTVTSNLDGSNEVPPNGSMGTGTLVGTYDANANQITINATYVNLSGTLTASHLHKATVGNNGPIIVNLNPTTGMTSGVISGTFAIDPADEAALIGGGVYINIHSSTFGTGEIRGQLELKIADPKSEVDVEMGDITVLDNAYGVILKSANGTCYRVQVDDNGNLVTVAVTCP